MVSREISQADLVGEKFGKLTEDYSLQSVIGEGTGIFLVFPVNLGLGLFDPVSMI